MGRLQLFAVSLGAHALLGVTLGLVRPPKQHEIIAITMAETHKPKPPPKVEPPPPEPEPPPAAPKVAKAKAAPPAPKVAEAVPARAATASQAMDALPDFGLSLSGGSGPGLAVPAGGGGGPRNATPAPAAAKVLARPGPKADDCGDPPAKPKLTSRPSPAYTEAARAAGISGKVRVEITVDEQGRVVSVRVLQGLGYGLDESAVAAAKALTFEPAVRCGKPSAATFKIGFNFAP